MDPVVIATLASALLGLIASLLARFLKRRVSSYVKKSTAETIKITSSSGESVNVEVRRDMSEEEIRLLLMRLAKLENDSSKTE